MSHYGSVRGCRAPHPTAILARRTRRQAISVGYRPTIRQHGAAPTFFDGRLESGS